MEIIMECLEVTLFCVCETQVIDEDIMPGELLIWSFPKYWLGRSMADENGILAQAYKCSIGHDNRYGERELLRAFQDGGWKEYSPSEFNDLEDTYLATAVLMDQLPGMQNNEFVELGPTGMDIDNLEYFESIFFPSPKTDCCFDRILKPLRAITPDCCPCEISVLTVSSVDSANREYIYVVSEGTADPFPSKYPKYTGSRQDPFFINSVEHIQSMEAVKFRPGMIANFGLAAYVEYLRVKEQSRSNLKFVEFLYQKGKFIRSCFCINENQKKNSQVSYGRETKSAMKEKPRLNKSWTAEKLLFQQWAGKFPDSERDSGKMIPRRAIADFIWKELKMTSRDMGFERCLDTLYKLHL